MTYELNEYQKSWLEDLETTDAKQCKGMLAKDGGFCCLGRAYVANGEVTPLGPYPDEGMVFKLQLICSEGSIGEFKDDEDHRSLADMNDEGEMTFKQIASFIRDNPHRVWADYELQCS